MNKNKTYKFGRNNIKCVCRPVGHGYEVSVKWDTKTIFVGNFVHSVEANRWWGQLNREIRSFCHTYWHTGKVTTAWYCNFFSNNLYKNYYAFLDKAFTKYNRDFARAVTRDVRKYRTMKRHWGTQHAGKNGHRVTLKVA